MKKSNNPFFRSKTAILSVFVAAGISMAIPACKKDDKVTIPAVSEGEASEVLSNAILDQRGGVMFQTTNALTVADTYSNRVAGAKQSDECGQTKTGVAINLSSQAGATYEYKFIWNWNYKLDCTTEKEVKSITVNYEGRIKFGAAEGSVDDTSSATLKISGLDADTVLTVNQTFSRTGTLKLGSELSKTFKTEITYAATDVKISKRTKKITSGTAVINISGISLTGGVFSYSGTITYSGSNKGTLKLKSGTTVDLSWM